MIFEISKDYLVGLFKKQKEKCRYTKINLTLPKTRSEYRAFKFNASLDRIDSKKGYIEGNVQWVHKKINNMKNNYSSSVFIRLCKRVAKHN